MAASYINIGGELLSSAILVRTEVVQELNEHDWCWMEIRQTEDVRMDIEEMLGKDIRVTTHDEDGAQRVIFDGFILESEIEYEIYGSYTARLTAVSRSYKLDCTPQESYWRKKGLNEVATALAAEDGLAAIVRCEATPPARNYVQWGETDFNFLKRIADDHQAWIRPTATGIEISDKFQPGTLLQWRTEEGLLSFSVKGRLSQPAFQGTHYNVRSMESTTLRDVKKRADFTGASDRMVNAVQRGSASLPPGHVVTDGRAATADEFRELLERESMRSVAGSVMGHGISRVERVRAGDTVQIQGVIDAKGTYGVVKVVHRWDPKGYTNEFWCTPWTKYVSPVRPSAPRICGLVTARVKDHNDPRHMGRLQVQYDWLEDGVTAWARMATPHAGADRGFLFLPEAGDEVLVAFENGDPERPLIIGSLWNGVDKAPRQEFWGGDVASNDVKRIVTKSGHRIQFSDKEGKEAIVIATPKKLGVSLFEKTDETGRPMILIHATEGDLIFSAPNGRIHFHSRYFSRETGTSGGDRPSSTARPAVTLKDVPTSPVTGSAIGASASWSGDAATKVATGQASASPGRSKAAAPSRETYSKGVVIKGLPEFCKQTKASLDRLKSTPTGKSLLDDLGKSGKTVTLTEFSEANGTCKPKNEADASMAGGKAGAGSDSTIQFNPSFTPWGTPNEVVLGHELVHAQHNARGLHEIGTINGQKAEELKTVGLPPFGATGLTENSIRYDLKLPLRTSY